MNPLALRFTETEYAQENLMIADSKIQNVHFSRERIETAIAFLRIQSVLLRRTKCCGMKTKR